VTLASADSFTGNTTISAGKLIVAALNGEALGGTSSITVGSGGTLLLGANNQINTAAALFLSGGTFAKGDYAEGAANSVGLGALTLSASGSRLDFGTGTVGVLSFASFTAAGHLLLIDNWTGTTGIAGTNATDRLIFDSDQASNLSNFSFTGYATGAREFDLGGGFFEVAPLTPVPEPSTYAAGCLGLLGVGYSLCRERRRRRSAGESLRRSDARRH
jgi:autotransporter-associated beta strand protein